MLDDLRSTLFRAITSTALDSVPPVRVQKNLARRLNTLLGSPLAPKADLVKRREARARLASLRAAPASAPRAKELAPVMVYFEKDRNTRELERTRELLEARGIPFRLLDVAGDEAAQAFVQREAKCELDELPITFVAGAPVGAYTALVEFDVSGALVRAVFGATN